MNDDTTAADLTADDCLDAVSAAKGVNSPVLSNNTSAKVAADGRIFVKFSTSHGYGRSNGLDALQDLDASFGLTYNTYGATQWAAQMGEGMDEDAAEAFVEVGAEYVNVRGYHVRITGISGAGFVEVEYPESEFGDSRGEPKESQLVDQLVSGQAVPLTEDEDDEGETLVTDGGVVLESGRATGSDVWSAALDIERGAKLDVTYDHGGGETTVTGLVTRVVVVLESAYGNDSGRDELYLWFDRKDGQRMWVDEGANVHTRRARHTKVGDLVSIEVSTENTVDLPEKKPPVAMAKRAARRDYEQYGDAMEAFSRGVEVLAAREADTKDAVEALSDFIVVLHERDE